MLEKVWKAMSEKGATEKEMVDGIIDSIDIF